MVSFSQCFLTCYFSILGWDFNSFLFIFVTAPPLPCPGVKVGACGWRFWPIIVICWWCHWIWNYWAKVFPLLTCSQQKFLFALTTSMFLATCHCILLRVNPMLLHASPSDLFSVCFSLWHQQGLHIWTAHHLIYLLKIDRFYFAEFLFVLVFFLRFWTFSSHSTCLMPTNSQQVSSYKYKEHFL